MLVPEKFRLMYFSQFSLLLVLSLTIVVVSGCGVEGVRKPESKSESPATKKTSFNETNKSKSSKAPQNSRTLKSSKSQSEVKSALKNNEVLVDGYEIFATTISAGKVKIQYVEPFLVLSTGVMKSLHKPPYNKVYFLDVEGKQILLWYPAREPFPYKPFFMDLRPCRKFTKEKHEDCFGLKTNLYLGYRGKEQKRAAVRIVSTPDLKLVPSYDFFRSVLFDGSKDRGFPILIQMRSGKHQKGKWITVYQTNSLTKKKFPRSTFDVPADFKVAKDLGSFMVGDQIGVEDMFEYKFNRKKK